MGDTFEYLVNATNIGKRNDKSRRSYVSFGDGCSEIEFTKACFDKLVISLSKVDILRVKVDIVEEMKKTC